MAMFWDRGATAERRMDSSQIVVNAACLVRACPHAAVESRIQPHLIAAASEVIRQFPPEAAERSSAETNSSQTGGAANQGGKHSGVVK